MRKVIFRVLYGIVAAAFVLIVGIAVSKPSKAKTDQVAAVKSDPLTELCKDWIYYRDQIQTRKTQGDLKGEVEARRAFRAFDEDLKNHPADQVAVVMDKLNQEGYRTRK